MPTRESLTTFDDGEPPAGASGYVPGAGPSQAIDVVPPDPAWPDVAEDLIGRVREALGWRVLDLQHVGSTSVAGLWAKPVIDLDLIVAAPAEEERWLPQLLERGFELRVREPWWHEHRMLRLLEPACHLHVFGPEAPEPVRHRLFRDWLRGDDADRELYAATKRSASEATRADGGHGMDYNLRKETVIREIYARLFAATGLS